MNAAFTATYAVINFKTDEVIAMETIHDERPADKMRRLHPEKFNNPDLLVCVVLATEQYKLEN